jgi:LAGLIDADG DNA endonuclease family protein
MGGGRSWQWQCLAVDTPIPTADGWKPISHVKFGDLLFDETGTVCAVTGVSDVKYGHKCFRITFDDDSQIVADESHLWEVMWRIGPNKWRSGIRTTAQITPDHHKIKVSKPLHLPDRELPIHPYVLGVWLGDGFSDSAGYCAHSDDIGEVGDLLKQCGVKLGPVGHEKSRPTMCYQTIKKLVGVLQKNNLIKNKHIPGVYLRASVQQRLALLQGLMDTDGTIIKPGRHERQCNFTTANKALALSFSELLRSLGMKSKFVVRRRVLEYRGNHVECAEQYQFAFTAYDDLQIFRLKRKASRQVQSAPAKRSVSKMHRIVSIEAVESAPVRCIEVNSPSRLYLAGEGMIPTHNTNAGAGPSGKVRLMERLRDFLSSEKLHVRSMETLTEMQAVTREGDTIEAQGSKKDDRVVALGLAVRCFEDRIQRKLGAGMRTRETEAARTRMSLGDQAKLYSGYMFDEFLNGRRRARQQGLRAERQQPWRR